MNRKELAQDEIITGLITEIQEQDPSPEETQLAMNRLRSRLAPAKPTRTKRTPMLRLAIAATVIATVTLSLWTPTREVSGGVAFGQVLDAIRQTTSMTYSLIEDTPDGGDDVVRVDVHRSRWIRLVSANKGTRIIDLEQSQLLRFDHPDGQAMHADLYTFAGQAAESLQDVCVTLADLNDLSPTDGEPLGHKMIDAQAVTGFRITRASLRDDLTDRSIWVIWADSETAEVVRVNIHHEHDEQTVTLSDFNFDVDFEDSLFELQPPPGYTIHQETIAKIERS